MSKTLQELQEDQGLAISANILLEKDRAIKKWQGIASILAVTTILLAGVSGYVSTRSTFIPYVINVDEKTGYATSLGSLKEVSYEPTRADIAYYLRKYVEQTRSIPSDGQVLRENLNAASAYLTPTSLEKFKQLYLDEFSQKVGQGVNRVDIISIVPVPNQSNTFQVRWKETGIENGSQKKEKFYNGVFQLEREAVSDKDTLISNPLGLFITDFNITEEQGGKS